MTTKSFFHGAMIVSILVFFCYSMYSLVASVVSYFNGYGVEEHQKLIMTKTDASKQEKENTVTVNVLSGTFGDSLIVENETMVVVEDEYVVLVDENATYRKQGINPFTELYAGLNNIFFSQKNGVKSSNHDRKQPVLTAYFANRKLSGGRSKSTTKPTKPSPTTKTNSRNKNTK